jgi:hypothetical protein
MKIIETGMSDGIDRIHEWDTVEDALASGRFDYCTESLEDEDEEEEWFVAMKKLSLEEFIGFEGHLFSIKLA